MRVEAWHFLPANGRLRRYDREDGTHTRRTLVKPGMIFRLRKGEIPHLCYCGFHGSERAIDALRYAPGPIACRTRHEGEIHRGGDKLCSSIRGVLWMADATSALWEFACWCAEQALLRERAAGREPDQASWDAIEARRKWLRGEIGDAELAAAEAAAWDKAEAETDTWVASREASRVASHVASWEAAVAAAWAAANEACGNAVDDKARRSAWDEIHSTQNTKLEALLWSLNEA